MLDVFCYFVKIYVQMVLLTQQRAMLKPVGKSFSSDINLAAPAQI